MAPLTIGDVVQRTGVPEGTLRMWERRHGFPCPERLPSGHRRYSEHDAELVRRVAAARAAGTTLAAAIEAATRDAGAPAASLYAELRRRRPELESQTLAKALMTALSHAIEDESLARAERPLLFAAFQRTRFYRHDEARWRQLARGAQIAVAFADFPRLRTPTGAPAEVPVARDQPFTREWALVCDAPGHAACLVGWEPPASAIGPAAGRRFEAIWSVDPEVVRDAARICAAIAAAQRPSLMDAVRERLATAPQPAVREQLRLAAAITSRTLARLG